MRIFRQHFVLTGFLILCASPVFAQSAQDNFWTGQAQCQLTAQIPSYAYQEIQTWAITGPPRIQGTLGIYPTAWSVTGQGQRQDVQGRQTTTMRWSTNVPPMDAPLAIFINSANQLIIKSYHAQLRVNGAVTGSRQVILSGSAQNPTAVAFVEFEYQFPAIEYVATSTNVTGTSSTSLNGGIGPMQPPGIPGTAVCQWQFVKGVASPTQQAPVANESLVKPTQIVSSGLTNSAAANAAAQNGTANSTTISNTTTAATLTPGNAQLLSSPVESKTLASLATLPAPTAFVAKHLGNGTVQFTWEPVPGAAKYRLEGTGIASAGLYVPAIPTNTNPNYVPLPPPVVQNVPPGMGAWKIAAVNTFDRWDVKNEATASAIVRYPPAHSPPWLSKSNGAGNPALTLTHYLSLCSQCLPGANFKDVMLNLGLRIDTIAIFPDAGPGCGTQPWCDADGTPWVDEQAARYTNVTEFENSTRVTGCWTVGTPNGRIICYTKTSDHGLQVIVKQTDYSWFLSFTGDPNAEVFDWVSYNSWQIDHTPPGQRFNSGYKLTNIVTLDSEGTKFPPHTCLACHGGQFTASGVTGSTLLPLDPGLIKPTTFTIAGFDYYYDPNNVHKVNQAVISISPSAAVARYLTGLYGIDPRVASGTGDPAYVPQSWTDEPGVYKSLVKPHCVMCHLATPSNLDFTIRGNFYQNKDLVYTTVCSSHSMPHAEAPYVALWSKDTGTVFQPGYIAAVLGYQSCP